MERKHEKAVRDAMAAIDAIKAEQCQHKWKWVEKLSDLPVPTADGRDVEYVDVNFFRCEICDEVQAVAD